MITIDVKRVQGDYGFEATGAYGPAVRIDNSPQDGGTNFGASPMQMMLMGMAGCSGIDIVSILKKQRQQVNEFTMHIEGEREKGKDCTVWQDVKIVFSLTGNIEADKAKRAVELSLEKYCSVAETLRRAGANINYEIKLNGEKV